MIEDVLKALGQMADPRFRRVLLLGVGLSVGLLAVVTAVLVWLATALIGPEISLPFIGTVGWLDNAVGWTLLPVSLVLSVFLMVPVASIFTGLFLDRIAEAVEDRHYPGLPPARRQPLSEMLGETARFLALVVGVNLLGLIAYLVLAPLALFLFWGINGFLLGREYAQMSAARRLPPDEARAFRKRNSGTIRATGVLMAIPLSIPVINLLVPVLGAATFTHLFQRLNGR